MTFNFLQVFHVFPGKFIFPGFSMTMGTLFIAKVFKITVESDASIPSILLRLTRYNTIVLSLNSAMRPSQLVQKSSVKNQLTLSDWSCRRGV